MKKKLCSLIIMLFLAVTFVITGCSPKGLSPNPDTDANVISNGGMTVIKENYLYYINGYLDESKLTGDDNKEGKVTHSAIYRTKIVDGKIVKDEDGFVPDTELVVSRVAGFSNGGFYIIDDYLYYTTPHNNVVDKDGKIQNDRVEFHRVNVNGTDDKLIYTTPEAQANLDWTLYKIGETVYITMYISNKIIVVNTSSASVVAEIADTTSYAIYKDSTYEVNEDRTNEFQNYIYYTRAITTEDNRPSYKGNVVCRLNIATGETEDLHFDLDYTYKILSVTNTAIRYTKVNSRVSGSLELPYIKTFTTNIKWTNAVEVPLADMSFTSYYFCDFGDNLFIGVTDSATWLVENRVHKQIFASKQTILGVYNNNVYYASENQVRCFNIRGEVVDGSIENELVTMDTRLHQTGTANMLDFDQKRLYVYSEYTNKDGAKNYYLNYIETDGTQRFVGKFVDEHMPPEPEKEEGSEEDLPRID